MNNDLISREALKRAFDEYGEKAKFTQGACQQLIDNAPTVNVEITEKQAITTIINSGWLVKHDKELREKYERPHGKWIKIFSNPFTNGYICPFCGHRIQVSEQFLPKVTECEACGADMRGEEE